MMNAWQIVLRSPRRSSLPRDRRSVRALVRALVRVAGRELLAFHISDTHVHMVVLADRERAGRLARAVVLAVGAVVGVPLPAAGVTPIENQHHLNAAFEYVLCNDDRHGVVPDPWRENTNLPDLLGARCTASATISAVRNHLPRVSGAHLRAFAGWSDLPPLQVTPELVSGQLADAAAAVVGRPNVASRHPEVIAVVGAACQLAREAKIHAGDTAAILGIGVSTAFRKHAMAEANPTLVAALRFQLQVRAGRPLLTSLAFGDEPARTPWVERTRVLPR